MDDEIYYLPEYYYWGYETLTLEISDVGDQFTIDECAFSAGVFSLDVAVSGLADGERVYERHDDDGRLSVTGEYNGQAVSLEA